MKAFVPAIAGARAFFIPLTLKVNKIISSINEIKKSNKNGVRFKCLKEDLESTVGNTYQKH